MGSGDSSLGNQNNPNPFRSRQSQSSPETTLPPLSSILSEEENNRDLSDNFELPPLFSETAPQNPLGPSDTESTMNETPDSPTIAVIQSTNPEAQIRRTLFIISYSMPLSNADSPNTPSDPASPPSPSSSSRRMVMMIVGASTSGTGEAPGSPPPFPPSGDGSGLSFSQFLNRILELYEPRGNPPASKEAIETLPQILVDEKMLAESPKCTVCCEEFEKGKNVTKLPCNHIFDHACIESWLKMHNTCPVCRFELESADPDYEKQRLERINNPQEQEQQQEQIPTISSQQPSFQQPQQRQHQNSSNNATSSTSSNPSLPRRSPRRNHSRSSSSSSTSSHSSSTSRKRGRSGHDEKDSSNKKRKF